jgi:hypothetical protein
MIKFISLAKRYSRPLTVAALVGTSALALAAPPALAASQSQDGRFRCDLFTSEPKVSPDGHAITGTGTSRCTGTGWQDQKVVVTLETQPLPGLLEVVAQASTDYSSSSSVQATLSWPCTFTGPRTYLLETSWYGDDGNRYAFDYPSSKRTITLTCTP